MFCLHRLRHAVVGVFLAMLFPAVAVEAPAKSLSARLETSMEQIERPFLAAGLGVAS